MHLAENKTMGRIAIEKKRRELPSTYISFEGLDGSHPLQDLVPESCVMYPARILPQGKPVYFNYILAKEMGLIPTDHPHQMNSELEKKLISTFSLQIINEHDQLTQKKFPAHLMKSKQYMATRYLQLQHDNKKGKTSGDGRGIWNGVLHHRGMTWDISSRGTGVTRLAPGSVEASKPLRTGCTDYGYGCGQAEIDELFGAAILAETFHLQGLHTERVLCIIDLGKGVGIGVRAAPNLLRPAHMFLYLKQNRRKELKAVFDYFIHRQIKNKFWPESLITSSEFTKRRGYGITYDYDKVLKLIAKEFGEFTAQLDSDYIFAWLDWDGDNVLAQAGIIDYGSVRQFGIRHDSYRYDDVDRFSTNLNQQKSKARQIVQVFCQLVDYLKTGNKRSQKTFNHHPAVLEFDKIFTHQRSQRLLYKMGFAPAERNLILQKHQNLFQNFAKIYTDFERAKVSGSPQKVADGINHPALYNMRMILKILPEHYLRFDQWSSAYLEDKEFFKKILSGFAKRRDTKMRPKHSRQIQEFQKKYKELILTVSEKKKAFSDLNTIFERTQKIHRETRMTGNALIQIVDSLLREKKKNLPAADIQKIIDQMIWQSTGLPEVKTSKAYQRLSEATFIKADLAQKIQNILVECYEDI